ncbi:MAG TPA: glutathione S-transferase [Burkholderiaceae bacterium]|nr:glutathione S-transferase [Burkholderiaceae bacterium]
MAALPVLYSFRRCPYAMRARLALATSQQACELREVVLRDKPRALLEVSPKATVPVLVASDGRVVDQSLDIMLWALRQADPERWLTPNLSSMLALVAECDGFLKHHLDRYKYPQRFGVPDGRVHRDQAQTWLAGLEHRLAQEGGVCGPRVALADAAIMPFVRQFAHTDTEWFESRPWPSLRGWLQRWEKSALFACVMWKYPPWKPGESGSLFPPASALTET